MLNRIVDLLCVLLGLLIFFPIVLLMLALRGLSIIFAPPEEIEIKSHLQAFKRDI